MLFKEESALRIFPYLYIILVTQVVFSKGSVTATNGVHISLNDSQNNQNTAVSTIRNISDLINTSNSALDTPLTSELIVRKDLFLFPINAPNLVLSEKQEVHTIPKIESKDNESVAEVNEVNEVGLAKLITTGGSMTGNEKNNQGHQMGYSKNNELKILNVVSGFEPESGIAVAKIKLPDTFNNVVSLSNRSIADLLSTLNEGGEIVNESFTESNREGKHNEELSDIASEPIQLSDQEIASELENYTKVVEKRNTHYNSFNFQLSKGDSLNEQEDMDVAEDIVFRPLFKYRQEISLKANNKDALFNERSNNRKRRPYGYESYSNRDYPPRYHYQPWARNNDYSDD